MKKFELKKQKRILKHKDIVMRFLSLLNISVKTPFSLRYKLEPLFFSLSNKGCAVLYLCLQPIYSIDIRLADDFHNNFICKSVFEIFI